MLWKRWFLVKWQERWRKEVKGRFFYKFQLRVSLKVSYSDKDEAKQTAIITEVEVWKVFIK